jgi:hypothetical protein
MHDLAQRRRRVIWPAAIAFAPIAADYVRARKERPCMEQSPLPVHAWRQELKVKIAWALAAKLVGLTLLWMLFFRRHG